MILLPRLDPVSADRLIEQLPEQLKRPVDLSSPEKLPGGVRYGATGGSPASHDDLLSLRQQMVNVAEKFDYPKAAGRKAATFDASLTIALGKSSLFSSPEALRDDVWAFIATVLVPDLVAWRFGHNSKDRFSGGVRNCFQRLWIRGRILDRGEDAADRWKLVKALTEDAMVQITERPSLAADRFLAREIAEAWVRTSEKVPKGSMEKIMRRSIIRIRMRSQIQQIDFLDSEELKNYLDSVFLESAEFFEGKK